MDKQDQLLRIIGDAYDSYDGVVSAPYEVRRKISIDAIAAVVRAYMESPEVVERVARTIAAESGVSDWKHVSEHGDYDSRDYWRRLARAALSAATGGDRG